MNGNNNMEFLLLLGGLFFTAAELVSVCSGGPAWFAILCVIGIAVCLFAPFPGRRGR